MKRLIIEGDWQRMDNDNGWMIPANFATPAVALVWDGPVLQRGVTVTVEDIPDPLPTEPGTRFWGRTDRTEPQWWFVQAAQGYEQNSDNLSYIVYVPSAGGWVFNASSCLNGRLAGGHYGLVRLPDPEPQP